MAIAAIVQAETPELDGDAPAVGTWEGALDTGVRLRLVLHITHSDGEFAATVDSPDQGATGIPVDKLDVDPDQVRFSITPIGASFRGRLDNDTLKGHWRQGGARLPLALQRVDRPTALVRPQTPQPPFEYDASVLTFVSADGKTTLAGTLTTPDSTGPYPAVVLLSGSGPQDRDATMFEHKPFLLIADYLTRRGIAVLRFDDRGVGESGGDRHSATIADFTEDALGAINTLAARDDIANIGVIGHSEGAMVGDLVAARSQNVAFLVRLAGPAVPGPALLSAQSAAIFTAAGGAAKLGAQISALNERLYALAASDISDEELREQARDVIDEAAADLDAGTRRAIGLDGNLSAKTAALSLPWFRDFVRRDAGQTLGALKIPVLALYADRDTQVVATQNAPAAKTRLVHPRSEVRRYAGLNHLFQAAQSGAPTEYGSIEQTLAPLVLEDVASWLSEQVAP